MVSKYEGKYWLHDEGKAFTIEKDGQSLKQDKRYIYSYGKGGFVIIDKKINKLKIMFDSQTNDFQRNSIENQKKMNPQYIQIIKLSDLTENEKETYVELRNLNNEYGAYPRSEFFKEWFLPALAMQVGFFPVFNILFLAGIMLCLLLL